MGDTPAPPPGAETRRTASDGQGPQWMLGMPERYRELVGADLELLIHLAQPGMLSMTADTLEEAKAMQSLVRLGLARPRVNRLTQVSISLRGEELARHIMRCDLGIA